MSLFWPKLVVQDKVDEDGVLLDLVLLRKSNALYLYHRFEYEFFDVARYTSLDRDLIENNKKKRKIMTSRPNVVLETATRDPQAVSVVMYKLVRLRLGLNTGT